MVRRMEVPIKTKAFVGNVLSTNFQQKTYFLIEVSYLLLLILVFSIVAMVNRRYILFCFATLWICF